MVAPGGMCRLCPQSGIRSHITELSREVRNRDGTEVHHFLATRQTIPVQLAVLAISGMLKLRVVGGVYSCVRFDVLCHARSVGAHLKEQLSA